MKEALLVGLCLAAGWVSAARAEVRTQTMDDGAIALENECLKAVISPIGARILSLADKARGREEVKVLPYAGGINEVRFGAALNLDDLRSRYALSVRPGQPGSQTVVAVANVVPTDEKPFAATVTKTYTLRDGSSCIHLAVEIANEGQDEIALIPWVRHLLQRGLKEQPEEAHMTDHGAFLRGHPVPGRPHLRRDHDWHFYPAANWTSRVVLPTEDGSNTLATVLRPSDMLKIYNWHRTREDFCTQEVIAAPLFVPPGQRRRWDYCLILTAPVRNVVYASPALVLGASPHPTGLAAGTKGLELAFAATEEMASLRVKGRLVPVAEPGRALQEYDLTLRGLSPREVVRQTIPLALPEHGHCQIRLSFARDGQPYWPGAAVEDKDDVIIPLVVGAQDTSEVVFPGRERRASRLRRVEPQNRMAVRAYGCDAFDAFAFPAGERCFRHDTLTLSGAGPVRLNACAGECESFQLILVPRAKGEATYEVAAADLTGPSGDRVACEGASEFLYVQTRMPSGYNPRFAVGEYPEALLPTKRVTLTGSERNHPLFVTYRVPREARPGVYRGTIELRDGRGVHRIPVELTVWRITMPARSRWMDTPTSLKMGGTGGVTVKNPDGRAMSREELLRATVDMHLKYRLTPCDSGMTANLLNGRLGEFEQEMRRYVEAGATRICLGVTPKLLQDHGARLPEVARYLAEKGWTGYFYVRPGFDEASTDLIPQIRAACQAWKNVSRIPIMETYYHEEPRDLYGMLDIWSRSVSSAPWIKERMAAGDRFWKVNAFPNALEPAPWDIRKRYLSFWDYGFTGTYIWTVKQWHGVSQWGEDHWCDAGVGNLAAVLMWPHETGILSTIRLEALRDAIEDNALFWMLREKVTALEGQALPSGAQAEALKAARALCHQGPVSERIQSLEDLERLRIQAGEALSALNSP